MRLAIMVRILHFQDPHNFNLEKLERYGIYSAVPDSRIIPFCAMNTRYRTKDERKFNVPIKDWRKEDLLSLTILGLEINWCKVLE